MDYFAGISPISLLLTCCTQAIEATFPYPASALMGRYLVAINATVFRSVAVPQETASGGRSVLCVVRGRRRWQRMPEAQTMPI